MLNLLITYLMFGASLASAVFLWFDTTAFVEYTRLVGLGKLTKANDFVEASADDSSATYPKFMLQRYPSFFTRLLACPKCLTFMLATLIAGPALGPLAILAVAYCGLYMYYILTRMMTHE